MENTTKPTEKKPLRDKAEYPAYIAAVLRELESLEFPKLVHVSSIMGVPDEAIGHYISLMSKANFLEYHSAEEAALQIATEYVKAFQHVLNNMILESILGNPNVKFPSE